MAIKTENPEQTKLILSIIGGCVFFLLNIFIPYFKIAFGYLERSSAGADQVFYASEAETKWGGATFNFNYDDFTGSDFEFLWLFLHYFQYFFLFGGLIATALVILAPILEKQGTELPFENPELAGFLLGAIVCGIEWGLFLSRQ